MQNINAGSLLARFYNVVRFKRYNLILRNKILHTSKSKLQIHIYDKAFTLYSRRCMHGTGFGQCLRNNLLKFTLVLCWYKWHHLVWGNG